MNFTDPILKQTAIENLLIGKSLLDGLGVPFFLSNGTLLGAIREHDLIPHDMDCDLGVRIEDFKDGIMPTFLKHFELYDEYGIKENGLQYSFKRNGVKLDIFFYYPEDNGSSMSVWKYGEQVKYIFPRLIDFSMLEFLGHMFRIPVNYKEFLESQYGDWQTPKQDWDWWDSPKNRKEVGYWEKFYPTFKELEPSSFAKSLNFEGRTILDLGCGNGRDTYYFAKKNKCIGVDEAVKNQDVVGATFIKSSISEFLDTQEKADIVYCRFLLHAVSEKVEDDIIAFVKKTGAKLYIETRIAGDVPTLYTDHKRRLINPDVLISKLMPCESIIGRGLSPYKDEDPLLLRIIK